MDSKASQADAVLHLVQDTRSPVPTVHIHGIENGMIQGSITGVARVFFGDELAVSDASGSFLLPADILTVNEITVPVPEGMLYVASKQGEKYYSVESSGGARIKPENRVYFPDKESAVKAGFRP